MCWRRCSSGSRQPPGRPAPPPERLGLRPGLPGGSAAERLEALLEPDLKERVKERVLKIRPSMKDLEWEWHWFEFKRFLFLCGVMRSVNMYSAQVDEIWHEVLMFTRDYQICCERFCGTMIHHAPHSGASSAPNPGERAWFDWVYGEVFEPNAVCGKLWGAFFRQPLGRDRIEQLESESAEELRKQLFNEEAANRHADLAELIDHLILSAKVQIGHARDHLLNGTRPTREPILQSSALALGLVGGALIFASLSDPDDFERNMQVPGDGPREDEKHLNGSGSCSSSSYCSGDGSTQPISFCNSGRDGGGSSDTGSGGSGCSSGSSCSSSSCSSSSCGSSGSS